MKKARGLGEEDWKQLEAVIGHGFAERERLQRALTHASAHVSKSRGDYERMEFLGDRVLGLCVAELLFSIYRNATEG